MTSLARSPTTTMKLRFFSCRRAGLASRDMCDPELHTWIELRMRAGILESLRHKVSSNAFISQHYRNNSLHSFSRHRYLLKAWTLIQTQQGMESSDRYNSPPLPEHSIVVILDAMGSTKSLRCTQTREKLPLWMMRRADLDPADQSHTLCYSRCALK